MIEDEYTTHCFGREKMITSITGFIVIKNVNVIMHILVSYSTLPMR